MATRANMFAVYRSMTAQPGRRDAVVDLIRKAARASVEMRVVVLPCSVNATLDEPDTVWVTELWTDKAHDTTIRSEPVRTATQQMLALLTKSPTGSYRHVLHAMAGSRGTLRVQP